MNFQRKLRKLVSFEGCQSALQHIRRLRRPVDVPRMLRALDPVKWADLRQRYTGAGQEAETRNSYKFADAAYWLKVNAERAQDLELVGGQPLRILDLGCGAGYFVSVCQQLGHEAIGLDIDENPLFRETIDLLGVRRVISRIEPFTPLPDLEGRFDLVTAHCICFQKMAPLGAGEWQQWGPDEWAFFVHDVRTRLLTGDSRLLLDFNPRGDGIYYPAPVKQFFQREGASIFRSQVLLRAGTPAAGEPAKGAVAAAAGGRGHVNGVAAQ